MRTGKSLIKIGRRYFLGFFVTTIVLSGWLNWMTFQLPTFKSVRNGYKPSDVWIVDRHGIPLESIRTDNKKRSLDWVRYSEVSPTFRNLLIEVEDHRFYSHPGIDPLAIAKAIWERMTGHSQRGASTLTMQLVGLLKGGSLIRRKNVLQKIKQIFLALKLNTLWTKEEILEAYINMVPFRGELVGLKAASLGYFGKNPSGLNQQESALLIALLRSPNANMDVVIKRACLILKMDNCQAIQNLAEQVLSKSYQLTRSRTLIPVISKNFIPENPANSNIISTSLDYRIQELALNALQEQVSGLKNQNVNDGAVLVLETQSGRVMAYVANAGAGFASANQIDGIQMRRQAGSTIKPFVYATAFDLRLLTSTSLLEDSPTDIAVSYGSVYHPKNYDQIFRGLVSVSEALGSSMNVPAVKALQLIGTSEVLDRLRALGFQQLQDDDYYGPSLALGAIDVTLWELTHAYRQFAIEGSTFSGPTRLSIFNILATPEYRRFTFGTDSLLTLPFPAAVKTGTSKDMRDNWCIGWTPQFTVGVWVGNFNGEPMWKVSGMTGAAPIWRRLMLALHPNPQGSLLKYEPPASPLDHRTISRIRYPTPDMLVGIDPEIPRLSQKLPIEIENPQHGHKLFLNHRPLSSAKKTVLWPLRRGHHIVELKTAKGEIIDSVKFEVR